MSAKYRRRRRLEKDRYYKALFKQISQAAGDALVNFISFPRLSRNFSPDPNCKYTGKIYYPEMRGSK